MMTSALKISGVPFILFIAQLPALNRAFVIDQQIDYFHLLVVKLFIHFYFIIARLMILELELLDDALDRTDADKYKKPADFETLTGIENLVVSDGDNQGI
jgi:hypothetical protein